MELVDKYTMSQLKKIMVEITGDEKLKIHDGRTYCDSDVWAETKTKACGYYDDAAIIEVLCDLFYSCENPRDFQLAILDNGMVGLFRSDAVFSNNVFFEDKRRDGMDWNRNRNYTGNWKSAAKKGNGATYTKNGQKYVVDHRLRSRKKSGKASIRKEIGV